MCRAGSQVGIPTLAKPSRIPLGGTSQITHHRPLATPRPGWGAGWGAGVGSSLPAQGSTAGNWGTHRSLPVGVGEDSVDLHLAPVGLSHIHPQLSAAGFAGAVQTGHIVTVVVLLPPPKTEPTGGVRCHQACQEPPSVPPPPRPLDTRCHGPLRELALWPRWLL